MSLRMLPLFLGGVYMKKLPPARVSYRDDFLTRGYARAYHELWQGQGYANESLAHS